MQRDHWWEKPAGERTLQQEQSGREQPQEARALQREKEVKAQTEEESK